MAVVAAAITTRPTHVPTSISANRESLLGPLRAKSPYKSFRNYVRWERNSEELTATTGCPDAMLGQKEEEIEFYRLFIMTTQWP